MMLPQEKKSPLTEWNQARSLGAALKVFFPLCSFILFKPGEFFREIPCVISSESKDRLGRAIGFALGIGYIKLFLDLANFSLFRVVSKKASVSFDPSFFLNIIGQSPFFLLRPLVFFVLILALVAIGIKLVLGFDKILVPAFLIVCYRSAADLFYCLPFVGGILALTWSIALLVMGLREVYRLGVMRSIFAGVVMPFLVLFSFLLAAGPILSRAMLSFYPEMRGQVTTINDLTAYVYTSSIMSAAETYKKDLGFYPAHLGVLKKYISGSVIDDVMSPANAGGYVYRYQRLEDQGYTLEVWPLKKGQTGRFVFYADQTGIVHLYGPEGPVIKNAADIEARIAGDER